MCCPDNTRKSLNYKYFCCRSVGGPSQPPDTRIKHGSHDRDGKSRCVPHSTRTNQTHPLSKSPRQTRPRGGPTCPPASHNSFHTFKCLVSRPGKPTCRTTLSLSLDSKLGSSHHACPETDMSAHGGQVGKTPSFNTELVKLRDWCLNGLRGRHEMKIEHAIYQHGFTIEASLLDVDLSGSIHVVGKGLVLLDLRLPC